MILREIIAILIACSWLSPVAAAQKGFPSPSTIPLSSTVEHPQDFGEIVVPITSVKTTPPVKLGITGKLGIRFLVFGLRGHAGARASAARRAAEGHAFDSVADVEAARVSQNAEEEAKPAAGTASPKLSRAARESAQLLASAVYDFNVNTKRKQERNSSTCIATR
jgi:hypothetical protein